MAMTDASVPPEAQVGIALGEVGHTSDVSVGQLGQLQATRPEVAQEPDLGVRAAPLAEEVTNLGDHGGRDQSRFGEGLEQARRAVMVGVCRPGGGDEQVGVEEDHSWPKPRRR